MPGGSNASHACRRNDGALRVTGIRLQVGPLSGIEPALLCAAYEQLRVDTVAEHAALVIADMPVRIRCKACGAECEAAPNRLDCPCCGSTRTILLDQLEDDPLPRIC